MGSSAVPASCRIGRAICYSARPRVSSARLQSRILVQYGRRAGDSDATAPRPITGGWGFAPDPISEKEKRLTEKPQSLFVCGKRCGYIARKWLKAQYFQCGVADNIPPQQAPKAFS